MTPTSCSGGSQSLTVDVTLRSSVPGGDLPDYVYGARLPGLPREAMRNRVYLYGPSGGRIGDVTTDDEDLDVTRVLHDTRPVAFATVDLDAGQTKRLQYVVETGPGAGR